MATCFICLIIFFYKQGKKTHWLRKQNCWNLCYRKWSTRFVKFWLELHSSENSCTLIAHLGEVFSVELHLLKARLFIILHWSDNKTTTQKRIQCQWPFNFVFKTIVAVHEAKINTFILSFWKCKSSFSLPWLYSDYEVDCYFYTYIKLWNLIHMVVSLVHYMIHVSNLFAKRKRWSILSKYELG